MSLTFNLASIEHLRGKLNQHPIYGALRDMDDIRCFMQHHIHSVWDFMSLLKYLQQRIAPAGAPWAPLGSPAIRRFINEIVLGEESDEGLPDREGNRTYCSHFELYCDAMREVGADPGVALEFAAVARSHGIRTAVALGGVPLPARRFVESTFGFIDTDKPHVVAAAFALGREHIIPGMFRAVLSKMAIGQRDAPAFHYYLERHIHLDEDHHGPLSLLMLNELCEGNATKLKEAEHAACRAIEARIEFWDGVLTALERKSSDQPRAPQPRTLQTGS